jgi:queuine tRNA-ribosyltransferase
MLASRLNTLHNLWFFSDLMRRMRAAIAQSTFRSFAESFYHQQSQEPAGRIADKTGSDQSSC